jgi:hypothetical protein
MQQVLLPLAHTIATAKIIFLFWGGEEVMIYPRTRGFLRDVQTVVKLAHSRSLTLGHAPPCAWCDCWIATNRYKTKDKTNANIIETAAIRLSSVESHKKRSCSEWQDKGFSNPWWPRRGYAFGTRERRL